ncbi:tetratricopeptide repeat protein [Actinoplanes sp. HUAS TT8]|uniref:tetratricopeptide repeat protein n=1 Tax=Actinoplanes sp. HUAS TT8 TaxID=3447453 RepID=UPI003F5251A0
MTQQAALLDEFLAARVRDCVVRLRDPVHGGGVFTGFFVSPTGLLITAFHAVARRALDIPADFALELSRDNRDEIPEPWRTVRVVWKDDWYDQAGDWAVLRIVHDEPHSYLPLRKHPVAQDPLPDCAPLRIYGFTASDGGTPGIGSLNGEFLRLVPERRRLRVAMSIRGKGQSGGPVIDLRSHSVIGSAIGFRDDERLTADTSVLDSALLSRLDTGEDFDALATAWRQEALQHLAANSSELMLASKNFAPPPLPRRFLAERAVVEQITRSMKEAPGVVLHGAAGSGKSMIAAEVARGLPAGADGRVFWYDLEVLANRSVERFLRTLGLYLLEKQGSVELIEECVSDGFAQDTQPAREIAAGLLRARPHVLVLDNIHNLRRLGQEDLLDILTHLASTAGRAGSRVMITSWDQEPEEWGYPVHEIEGFSGQETAGLLGLHDITVSESALRFIADLGKDITCVEQFVRSPGWRQAVEQGAYDTAEPAELLRHWLNRYLGEIPQSARRILLSLAVLGGPEPTELVREVAKVGDFNAIVETLRHSPPLIRESESRLTVHSNVSRAVLATSDAEMISAARGDAADVYVAHKRFLGGARVLMEMNKPRSTSAAVDLMFDNRDAIIGQGNARPMRHLIDGLLLNRQAVPESKIPRLHVIIASTLNINGEFTRAARQWEMALTLLDDKTVEAAATRNRYANTLRMASRYTEAKEQYEQASRIARALRTHNALRESGWANLGLGKLHRLSAEYATSVERYEAAGQDFETIFDRDGVIEVEFGLGEVRRLMGDWPGALEAYTNSLEQAQATDNLERQGYGLWGVAEVRRLTGELEEAHQSHREGLRLCQEVGDTRSEGWAFLGLAETARQSERFDEAEEFYAGALKRFTETGSGTEIAHTRMGVADLRRVAHGELPVGELEEILAVYSEKQLAHPRIQCQILLAMARRAEGKERKAKKLLTRTAKEAAALRLGTEEALARALADSPDQTPPITLNFP